MVPLFGVRQRAKTERSSSTPWKVFCKILINAACTIIDIIHVIIDVDIEIANDLVTFQLSIALYRLLAFVIYIDISNESNDIVVEFVDIHYGLLLGKIAVIGGIFIDYC